MAMDKQGVGSISLLIEHHRRISALAVFLVHQSLAAWGVIQATPWVLVFLGELEWHFGWKTYMSQAQWLLYGTPWYPTQVGLALFLGWVLGGTLQHRSMLWVWILPLVALSSAFMGFPLTGHLAVARYMTLNFSSRWSYFFGWGNGIQPLDQVLATLPFYSASAYSLGALLARSAMRAPVFFATMKSLRIKRLILLVAVPWFCLKLLLNWPQGAAQNPVLRTWLGLRYLLEGLFVVTAFVTLIVAIAVALVGRQFFLTRFFLKPGEAHDD
jgi:hypothetical protein